MKLNIENIKSMKNKEKISMLTAYDFSTAGVMDGTVDMILVGDSLGMVVYGDDNTLNVTMQDMIRPTQAVKRAVKKSIIIGDMPANSYNNKTEAVENAKLLIKAGADCVKIENQHEMAEAIVKTGIGVIGHVGLTPQTITDYRMQGKDEESADKIFREARNLEKAGCFAVVLECIPADLAKKITAELKIITIGIGAGLDCDGQVLVSHDVLGLFEKIKPDFAKTYVNLSEQMKTAFTEYNKNVKRGTVKSIGATFTQMQRLMFKSKIHRTTVTDADLDYEGSITIDSELMKKANIVPGEQVHVLNIDNGERIETYTIEGEANSGCICINGAAAHKFKKGEKIIIISYVLVDEDKINKFKPKVVLVDENNKEII